MRDRLKIKKQIQPIQRETQVRQSPSKEASTLTSSTLLDNEFPKIGSATLTSVYGFPISHAGAPQSTHIQRSVLQLQRQHGNHYIQRLLMKQQAHAPAGQNRIRPVQIIITATETGTARLSPYRHEDHKLQSEVIYQVPLYAMLVTGHDASGAEVQETFDVVRFGIQWLSYGAHRVVGLANEQTHALTWDDTFLDGSWRIYDGFFIHVGATDPDNPWGAIGCIEVVYGRWPSFLNLIARLAGVSDRTQISQAGSLTVIFEAATRPELRQVTAQPTQPRQPEQSR